MGMNKTISTKNAGRFQNCSASGNVTLCNLTGSCKDFWLRGHATTDTDILSKSRSEPL